MNYLSKNAGKIPYTALLISTLLWAWSPCAAQQSDLANLALEIAQARLTEFGPDYEAKIDETRNIIYISALDDKHLNETTNLLSTFTDFQRAILFREELKWNVTVILPLSKDYTPLAPAKNITGFYKPPQRELISIDRSRVLVHEFTHALHHSDMAAADQNHPIWIVEGLACLFEASKVTDSSFIPQVDGRLTTLQAAIRKKETIALDKFLQMSRKEFHKDTRLAYAQSRYIMLYLYQNDKLSKWYNNYKSNFSKDTSGRKAMEKAFLKPIYEIEKDFLNWSQSLQLPWGEASSNQARLGAQVKAAGNGVKVVGFVRGSAGETAGRLIIGDIITEFNGYEIRNPAEFVGAVRATGANQTVIIKVQRHGREVILRQPLSSPKAN